MKEVQSRWRSKVLWLSIVAQIIAIGQLVGLWTRLGIDAGALGNAAAGVIGIAATVGIINDPTNPSGI